MTVSIHTLPAKSSPTPRFSSGAVNGAGSSKIQIAQNFHRDPDPPETGGPAWLGYSLDTTGRAYHGFTLDTPEEVAAAIFLQRYGRPAEFVFVSRGNLLCGPIPEVTP